MTDIFREVEDDYRQELLLDFWKRHAKELIAAVILVILAAIAVALYQNWQTRVKEQQTSALSEAMTLVDQKSSDDGIAALNDVINKTTGHQRIAARFALARLQTQKGDIPEALAVYETIEKDSAANRAETGLAEIARLQLQIDSGDPATLAPELAKLADDKNPWRFSAREMQGLLAIRQNDPATAHKIFDGLAQDKAAPDGIQSRAADLAQLYRGD
jgi:hypothetical protein